MPLAAIVLITQGSYWLLTGAWPLVHLHSFLYLTGAKTDLWLVRVVGMLITVVGGVLLAAGLHENLTPEIMGLAVAASAALMVADLWFVADGSLAPMYLVDAKLQAITLVAWGVVWWQSRGIAG
jgi:hypothetical protein